MQDDHRLEMFMVASLIGILANPQRHAPPADIAKAALIQAKAAAEALESEQPSERPWSGRKIDDATQDNDTRGSAGAPSGDSQEASS